MLLLLVTRMGDGDAFEGDEGDGVEGDAPLADGDPLLAFLRFFLPSPLPMKRHEDKKQKEPTSSW